MAERLADIVSKIGSVHQLQSVVTAMRGIAAARAQQARGLSHGIRAYTAAVEQAMGQALTLVAEGDVAGQTGPQRRGVILFCAEQGFVGAFSERVIEAAKAHAEAELQTSSVFILGTRGAAIAQERGLEYFWSAAMASHAEGLTDTANHIADALYAAVAEGRVNKLDLFFPSSATGKSIEIIKRSLLPLDLARFRRPPPALPPITTLAPRELLEGLAAEYVFAELCDAVMQAFVAENEARMMTMSNAKTNIEKNLAALLRQEQHIRQNEITNEILELAAGTDALRSRT